MTAQNGSASLGVKLQALPKGVIYAVLILAATIPLFFTKVKVPNKPVDSSIDFYGQLMALPEGSRVLIGSDWTNSTRGESSGEMEALLRLLMRRKIKFAIYSTADPQAPQVSRDVVQRIAKEHKAKSEDKYEYQSFRDWVSLGYYPNTEGTLLGMENNILAVFGGKKDLKPGVGPTDIRQSEVFKGVKSISDFNMLILITASDTNQKTLERITKVPLMFMVTGVMVPENQNYYASGQLKGLCGGIKGVYDLETIMEVGLNNDGPGKVETSKYDQVQGYPGWPNAGKGTSYYLALHFCLGLLIVMVLIGNVGMYLARRNR